MNINIITNHIIQHFQQIIIFTVSQRGPKLMKTKLKQDRRHKINIVNITNAVSETEAVNYT